MKRKVVIALAIGAGCCLIAGNVLMAQPSTPKWEYIEQTDDGKLLFHMGEIELKVPEDWADSYEIKQKDGGEAFYLKDSDEKKKKELFWVKDSEGLKALWDEEYRAQWEPKEDASDSNSQKTEDYSEESLNDSGEQEAQNPDNDSSLTEEQENIMSQTGFNGCYLYGEDGSEVYVEQSQDGNWYDENGVCYGSREEIDDAGENGDPITNENGETYYWTSQE